MSPLPPWLLLHTVRRLLNDDDQHDHDGDDQHDHAATATTFDDEGGGSMDPWWEVIVGSFIVQLTTFSGVLISALVTLYSRAGGGDRQQTWRLVQHRLVPPFAAGALIATTFFLLVPEALELLAGGHVAESKGKLEDEDHDDEKNNKVAVEGVDTDHEDEWGHDDHGADDHDHGERGRLLTQFVTRLLDGTTDEDHDHDEGNDEHGAEHEDNEAEVAWKFGASIMGGFVFPLIVSAFFPDHTHADVLPKEEEETDADETKQLVPEPPQEETAEVEKKEGSGSNTAWPLNVLFKPDNNNTKEVEMETQGQSLESPPEMPAPTTVEVAKDDSADDDNSNNSGNEAPRPINWSLANSILIGDFFHNFTDGVFIGTAFQLCDTDLGWTIVAGTIYHEIAQEIGDFALLTHVCNMPVWMALLTNFVSGFSVLIGGAIVLLIDLSEQSKGATLAFSAGVYLYIAASECVPRAQSLNQSLADVALFVLCFAVGAVPIGLVLLNHEHCDGGGGEHSDH